MNLFSRYGKGKEEKSKKQRNEEEAVVDDINKMIFGELEKKNTKKENHTEQIQPAGDEEDGIGDDIAGFLFGSSNFEAETTKETEPEKPRVIMEPAREPVFARPVEESVTSNESTVRRPSWRPFPRNETSDPIEEPESFIEKEKFGDDCEDQISARRVLLYHIVQREERIMESENSFTKEQRFYHCNRTVNDYNEVCVRMHREIEEKAWLPETEENDEYNYRRIIDCISKIKSGEIYSSGYFGYREFKYKGLNFTNILVTIFLNNSNAKYGSSILESRARTNGCLSRETKEKAEEKNKELQCKEIDASLIYTKIREAVSEINMHIKTTETFIYEQVDLMTIPELYDLMEHRYDPEYQVHKGNRSFEEPYFYWITPDLEKRMKDELTECVRKRITTFIEKASKGCDLKGLVYTPGFCAKPMNMHDEYEHMKFWAWNYLMIFRIEDAVPKIDDNLNEFEAAVRYLVDILPPLYDYYAIHYASFEKRYNSPKRVKYYESQLDYYKEHNGDLVFPYQLLEHY